MHDTLRRVALLLGLLLFTSGCASRSSMVVLVQDPDGKTGRITIANQAGAIEIASPYQATTIRDLKDPPTPPADIDKATINSIFSEALSVQPKRPVHFILYFTKDTALTVESEKLLNNILSAIKERNSIDISVIGHTDSLGSRELNMALSRVRANAVKDILVRKGVGADNIRTTSHGKENPLIPTEDNVSEPKNRRAEVVVR